MIRLSLFNGKGGLSQAEVEMAAPDESEAADLKIHVLRCQKRFRLLAEGQNDLHSTISELKWIVIVGVGYLVVISQPAQNVIGAIMKVMGG